MKQAKNKRVEETNINTEFLLACEATMGSLDITKLDKNKRYKTDFFNKLARKADPDLFALAAQVNAQ